MALQSGSHWPIATNAECSSGNTGRSSKYLRKECCSLEDAFLIWASVGDKWKRLWSQAAWGFRTQQWYLFCSLVSSLRMDFLSSTEPEDLPFSRRPVPTWIKESLFNLETNLPDFSDLVGSSRPPGEHQDPRSCCPGHPKSRSLSRPSGPGHPHLTEDSNKQMQCQSESMSLQQLTGQATQRGLKNQSCSSGW